MGQKYRQLSRDERLKIERLWHIRATVNEMARILNRHRSTIFLENSAAIISKIKSSQMLLAIWVWRPKPIPTKCVPGSPS